MARCPRCRMPLGLMTSFALSNFQEPRGLHGPSPLIAFECCHCATRLTYRFETAALCWILAIAGLLVAADAWSSRGTLGTWLVAIGLVLYWLALASVFSLFAQPIMDES